jgi:hypothetical protein
MGTRSTAEGTLGISGYALSLMIEAQTALEIEWARRTGVDLHMIQLLAPPEVPFWDYTQAEHLIERGRKIASDSLAEQPIRLSSAWQARFRMRLRNFPLHPMHDIEMPMRPRMRPPTSTQTN